MAKKRKGSSTEQQRELWAAVDEAIDGWVEEGLVEFTGWTGQPLILTPLPKAKGTYFDQAAVERVLKFFLLLRQLIGRHAGVPFRLLDWQVRYLIAPVFGIKRADGLRAIRTVWFEIPRKNGKSTLCSGLGLYLAFADREPGAQVFAAAGDKTQARIVFGAARDMATASPPLRKKLGRGLQRHLLEHPVTHSVFRAVSADGDRQHGLNVHGGIIDEVHVHKNPDVVDAIETGVGSREQPLIVFITTADDGDDDSIYATKRDEIEQLAAGHSQDDEIFGVVFGVDERAEGFDPFSDETLQAANPGYNVTVLADYLRGKARQAQRSPAQLNRYLRLHLNVRTKQTVRWLNLADWDACGVKPRSGVPRSIDLDSLEGRLCYGGLDLSSTSDFTAFSLWFPPEDEDGEHVWLPFFWLPEDNLHPLVEKTQVPFDRWAKTPGHHGPALRLTEGNVVDYVTMRELITDTLGERYDIRAIGYDPWNAGETVTHLADAGYEMEKVGQTYPNLNGPSKALERLVLSRRIHHGGHPVLRWNVDCVEIATDQNDNIKPVKPKRQTSRKRIDGVASGINALAMHLLRDDAPSRYEDADLEVG